MKNNGEKIQDDESTVRRLISGLSFIREDLRGITRLNIKTPKIKRIVNEIKDRIEELMDIFFPERKGGE